LRQASRPDLHLQRLGRRCSHHRCRHPLHCRIRFATDGVPAVQRPRAFDWYWPNRRYHDETFLSARRRLGQVHHVSFATAKLRLSNFFAAKTACTSTYSLPLLAAHCPLWCGSVSQASFAVFSHLGAKMAAPVRLTIQVSTAGFSPRRVSLSSLSSSKHYF
jgi:hypothetical protein